VPPRIPFLRKVIFLLSPSTIGIPFAYLYAHVPVGREPKATCFNKPVHTTSRVLGFPRGIDIGKQAVALTIVTPRRP
jgi:hypothetical protein